MSFSAFEFGLVCLQRVQTTTNDNGLERSDEGFYAA